MTFHGRISVWLKSRGTWHRWLNQQHLLSPGRPCLSAPPTRPIVDMSYSRHFMDFQGSSIPTSMKKLVATKLNSNFREAVTLRQDAPVPLPGDGDLLVRNRFVGINASDINYSAGRYDISIKPPFDVGFEGIGEVVALGLSASAKYTVGQSVAYLGSGAFAEYKVVPAKEAIPVPSVKPEFLTLLGSQGLSWLYEELHRLNCQKRDLEHHWRGMTSPRSDIWAYILGRRIAKCHYFSALIVPDNSYLVALLQMICLLLERDTPQKPLQEHCEEYFHCSARSC